MANMSVILSIFISSSRLVLKVLTLLDLPSVEWRRGWLSKTTLPGARHLLLPLVVPGAAGPVEEDGEPVAGLPAKCLSDGKVRAHQVRHADEEDVV